MNYLLDTNILLAFLRKSPVAKYVNEQYQVFDGHNSVCLSAVSLGEIGSLAIQNRWSRERISLLTKLLHTIPAIDINIDGLISLYAEIDAFSQNKLPEKALPVSARNMGKNDLWIGATAAYTESILITTDKDFDHLHGHFIEMAWIDPTKHK